MKRKLFISIMIFAGIWLFLHINNSWLQTTSYTVESERIPQAFDGLKIVQLSDLHDATFGEEQADLAKKVESLKPDLIFLTGDIIDSNRYNLANTLNLVEKLVKISDVFYVTGNHEVAINQVSEISEALQALGVKRLRNESRIISVNGEEIAIAGIDDPLMRNMETSEVVVGESIDIASENVPSDAYTLLLSHRPEVFDVYADKKVDLVFTGHAHGGQIRIPGLGGMIAPSQGWFPSYTSGKHEQGMTTMIVNRGLGNSLFPFRILNRPEIVILTLKSS